MSNGTPDIVDDLKKVIKEWLKGLTDRMTADLRRYAEDMAKDMSRYAVMVANGENRRAAALLRHLKAQASMLATIITIRERRKVLALWQQTVTMLARFAAQMLIKLLAAV